MLMLWLYSGIRKDTNMDYMYDIVLCIHVSQPFLRLENQSKNSTLPNVHWPNLNGQSIMYM